MKTKLCCLTMLFALTGCAVSGGAAGQTSDIFTHTATPPGKIAISVMVKYAFSIKTFEKAAEEKFPNLDLIQVGNYTGNMGVAEYERRIKHGDLTDIVMTWPLETGEEYWADQLLDLSAMPFTSKYNISMLNTIARDGSLYYLPGPAQLRGIVYNKTLFEENSWQVPTDFESFLSLCETIEESGMRSLQLGLGNSEVLETAFTGFGYAGSFSKPSDAQWLADYNNGNGSFGDQFAPALDTFQTLIDHRVIQTPDLDLTYSDRERMLFNRECAMVEDSAQLARMGFDQTGTTDEFALMPFFNPGKDGDWARLYMVCYIGLNKQLALPENKEKYDLVMQLMDYISTEEGQLALSGDTGGMFSSLKGMPPSDVPEISSLLPALNHGRYAVFPTLKNASGALRTGLAGMIREDTTADEVIEMVDAENRLPTVAPPLPSLGIAEQNFSLIETGSFVTDVMRDESGAEIALFLDNGKDGRFNGKGISARFYNGHLNASDIACILPDLKHGEAGVLQIVTMTGENLLKTLEYSITVDNNIGGWFYYFSGLRMDYAPTAPFGSRVSNVTDANGKPIERTRVYSIAAMDETMPAEYVLSTEDVGITISDMLTSAISTKKSIEPSNDGRLNIV